MKINMEEPMVSLEILYQRTVEHELKDQQRFKEVHDRLEKLPEEIKVEINGSVHTTVQENMNRFKWDLFKWFGMGFLVIMVGLGVSWGSLTTTVKHNTDSIDELKASFTR